MALLASRPFYGVCPLGRETFMVPVLWEDGWPYIGSKTGLIEKECALPDLTDKKTDGADWTHESSCDHFDAKMPPHWLMLRMPAREQDAALSLAARPGALRLFTRAATMRGRDHPAFAGRRLRHQNWAFSAALEFTPKASGESAGIILLQSEDWQYRFELFLADSGRPSLRLARAAGKEDEVIASVECPECAAGTRLVLAARCDEMELSFFYGKNQYALKHCAGPVDGRILSPEYAGGFVGTLAGVFASGNGKDTDNYADVFWAEYISA